MNDAAETHVRNAMEMIVSFMRASRDRESAT